MLKRLLHPGDVLLGTVYAPKSLANDNLKVQGVTTLGFKLLVFRDRTETFSDRTILVSDGLDHDRFARPRRHSDISASRVT